eukprot:2518056-Pyramimonas_sp.AAC.1
MPVFPLSRANAGGQCSTVRLIGPRANVVLHVLPGPIDDLGACLHADHVAAGELVLHDLRVDGLEPLPLAPHLDALLAMDSHIVEQARRLHYIAPCAVRVQDYLAIFEALQEERLPVGILDGAWARGVLGGARGWPAPLRDPRPLLPLFRLFVLRDRSGKDGLVSLNVHPRLAVSEHDVLFVFLHILRARHVKVASDALDHFVVDAVVEVDLRGRHPRDDAAEDSRLVLQG